MAIACLCPAAQVDAMTIEQMKALPGARLLELPLDQVFKTCGLPTAIADLGAAHDAKAKLRWRTAEMSLSRGEWDVLYTRQREDRVQDGWLNAGNTGAECLADVSRLALRSREIGTVRVTKKAHDFGYVTQYQVPSDALRAHRVVGIDAGFANPVLASVLVGKHGKPDEVIGIQPGEKLFRYWVVEHHKQMPVSAFAVDFRFDKAEKFVVTFAVSTDNVGFVRERLDQLLTEWEKMYVLD
jgi:hypothetical protein